MLILYQPCKKLQEVFHKKIHDIAKLVTVHSPAPGGGVKSFDDPNMFRMAHIAYGFNPGAQLTGNIVEDERVWGCTEWGIGYVSPFDAPPNGQDAKSHCDGICLDSSVWLDGEAIMENGKIVDKELKKLSPV
jgi:hypothetical protein